MVKGRRIRQGYRAGSRSPARAVAVVILLAGVVGMGIGALNWVLDNQGRLLGLASVGIVLYAVYHLLIRGRHH